MTLQELLAELSKLDRTEVVNGLQSQAQPIYQAIFDKGHSVARTTYDAKKGELETQITSLTSQLQQKDAELKTANEKAPEIATLRQQHEAQIRDLQSKHEAKIKEKDDALSAERRDRWITDLRVKLVEAGVDAEYAEVLSLKPDVQKRIRLGTGGVLEVLQSEGEVPFAPAKGKTGIDLLADELAAAAPPKFVVSKADRGSETKPGSKGGPAGGSFYDDIRKQAEERNKQPDRKPLAERMGMTQSV